MPTDVKQYDILVSCPSDVESEYSIIRDVIDTFNRDNGNKYGVRLQVRHWSTDSYPMIGSEAQAVLNEQFVLDCDFAVAIFWTKAGTPTSQFSSGTIEEIERLIGKGSDVFLYFSNCPVRPSACEPEHLNEIRRIKANYRNKALYYEYSDLEQFKSKFSHNIAQYMGNLFPATKKISADDLFEVRTGFPEKIRTADYFYKWRISSVNSFIF